jgi:hypothetical protein
MGKGVLKGIDYNSRAGPKVPALVESHLGFQTGLPHIPHETANVLAAHLAGLDPAFFQRHCDRPGCLEPYKL